MSLVLSLLVAVTLQVADPSTLTLEQRMAEIVASMPGPESGRYVVPSDPEREAWRSTIAALADGNPTAGQATAPPFYRVDVLADGRVMLWEPPPILHGWGTYVFAPGPTRAIVVEAPHPLYDRVTETEAVALFRGLQAACLFVAGTHRCASMEPSPCTSSPSSCSHEMVHASDVAHDTRTPFQIAHEVVGQRLPHSVAISLHGNKREACPDVFLSDGVGTSPSPRLLLLKGRMEGPISVGIAGDAACACPLRGETNVQGRWSNGSPNPCTIPATRATGRFIHVEQKLRVRQDPALYGRLIDALKEVDVEREKAIRGES